MNENKDKDKIVNEHNDFTDLCLTRMLDKYDAGLRGWDNPDLAIVFQSKLETAIVQGKYVDAGNYSMILDRFQRLAK